VTRLASTRYRDAESGRMVTVAPDDDYFLVWSKAGAREAPGGRSPDAVTASAAEEEEAAPGGLFGSFGTSLVRRRGGASLATVAERGAERGGQVEDRAAAREAAAAARRQKAEESRAAAAAERERRARDAVDRKAAAAAERARGIAEKQQVCVRPFGIACKLGLRLMIAVNRQWGSWDLPLEHGLLWSTPQGCPTHEMPQI
jgi:hypothetical protein